MKKIAVVGLGYVGLGLAIEAAKHFEVVGLDLDENRINLLQQGNSYIEGIESKVIAESLESEQFVPTSDPTRIENSDVVVICVPTPLDENRKPDLRFILSACNIIIDNLKKPALIINESTSYPGTLRNIIAKTIREKTNLNHSFAISPERVDPGNLDWKLKNTPRLLAGLDDVSTVKAQEFYSTFASNVITVNSPEVAELAKLFENTFRQVNIALVNELAIISNSLGVGVYDVLNAAETKPYGFMRFNPGPGVGGHCIPVDPTYLAYSANENGTSAKFIELANKINLEMPAYILDRCRTELDEFDGKKVLLAGVSYKANVADTRETPAEIVYQLLEKEGAKVYWYDPLVFNWKENKISEVESIKFDLTIVQVLHNNMNLSFVKNASNLIFDCTGKITGAIHL